MHVALDPVTLKLISVGEYVRKFGQPTLGKEKQNIPRAVCPFCGSPLYVRAKTPVRAMHFAHGRNPDCPTIEPARLPYLVLKPTDPDPDAGLRLRRTFRKNWQRHFAKLASEVPGLNYREEFIPLLERSLTQRIWEYRDLAEDMLPYVLLLLADFPPWTGFSNPDGTWHRRYWLRFYLGRDAADIPDLWIGPEDSSKLYRASFEPPSRRTSRPKYENLVRITKIPLSNEFLQTPIEPPRPFIVERVEEWLARHPAFQ